MTLEGPGPAAAYTLLLWWTSTGVGLWLNRRPERAFAPIFLAASAAALLAVFGVATSSASATPGAALCAFTSALGLWAWLELGLLMGFVAGPSTRVCPPEARGLRRFRMAAATLIFHELAIATTLALIAVLTLRGPNKVALVSFATLAGCRLFAKLNLFFGVPHFTSGLLPARLRHLESYFRRTPASLFLGLTIVGLTLGAGAEAVLAFAAAEPFQATAFALLFALTGLAAVEHLFMALPLADTVLWRWALTPTERARVPSPRRPAP